MRAFLHNPPFGAGPSAITESTDGDYFRWLGETGLFGTGFFIAILFTLVRTLLRSLPQTEDKTVSMLVYGFCFGVLALAVNALMIDVFEASKVAFTFWTLAGVYLGMQYEPSDVHTS
jgi:O-antigen ligase